MILVACMLWSESCRVCQCQDRSIEGECKISVIEKVEELTILNFQSALKFYLRHRCVTRIKLEMRVSFTELPRNQGSSMFYSRFHTQSLSRGLRVTADTCPHSQSATYWPRIQPGAENVSAEQGALI